MPRDPLEVVVTPAEEEYYMRWRIVEHGPPDKYGCRERLAWFPEGEAEAAEFFVHAAADTGRLVAEVEALRDRLTRCQASEFHGMHERMVGLHRGLEVQAAEVTRLRGRLGELEWAGQEGCPVCSQYRVNGHGPGCWMPEELGQ
jgi:hypothetical protein